jgi:HD-GYP domain-containing protein (c-di-GMP phosphodiesterase class II)
MARQLEDLAQAGTVARSLMGVVELEDLLGLCAALVSDCVSCQSSTVAVYEARQEAIGLMVRTHPGDETAPALCWLRTPLESGVLCRAAHTQKSIHIEEVAESTLLDPDENQWWPEGRLLVIPTPCRGQSVGVAVLHRPADSPDFSAQDLKHLTELAKLMGPAILTAKVHHQQRCAIYASLEAVAEATEDRSPGVKGHAVRVLAYAQQTVPALDLTQAQIGALQIAARLHDLGWVTVPDGTVNHIGPLTESQWERVRRHPEAGANFLKPLDFFGEVGEIIRAHHESYDGTGYPDLKAGEEIPLLARLLAVADAFDAMTSPRPHRAAMSLDEALDQIQRLAGQQFDPRMAGALAAVPKEILAQIQASHR